MKISPQVAEFVNSLQVAFRLRVESEEDLLLHLQNMDELIGDFPADVLDMARREIMQTYKRAEFPVPAFIFETCRRMAERKKLAEQAARMPLQSHSGDRTGPFEDGLVLSLLRTPLGRQAASEGWAGALRDFLFKAGRLPDAQEQRGCRTSAQEMDETLEKLYRDPPTRLNKSLIALGESIIQRRKIVEDYILGRRQDIKWVPLGDRGVVGAVVGGAKP
jgi:hypothetical protein